MPGVNKYENKIPYFYRRKTLEILLFGHVTALHEQGMTLEEAIKDFQKLYNIDEEEYPVESAKVIYNRVRNNFIWSNLKEGIDNLCK